MSKLQVLGLTLILALIPNTFGRQALTLIRAVTPTLFPALCVYLSENFSE